MIQYSIPIDPIPNQSFDIDISDQRCRFEFITKGVFLYMNLTINEEEKLNGIICLNNENLLLYSDVGIKGRLYFLDTQEELDPIYYGLGDRWILIYEE